MEREEGREQFVCVVCLGKACVVSFRLLHACACVFTCMFLSVSLCPSFTLSLSHTHKHKYTRTYVDTHLHAHTHTHNHLLIQPPNSHTEEAGKSEDRQEMT